MQGVASDRLTVEGCCKGGTGQRAGNGNACTAEISSKLIIGSPAACCTVDSSGQTDDPDRLLRSRITPAIDTRLRQPEFAVAAGRARGLT